MKYFDLYYCFFDSYGDWKPIRIYGSSKEEAMDNARKEAVNAGITGGLFFADEEDLNEKSNIARMRTNPNWMQRKGNQ